MSDENIRLRGWGILYGRLLRIATCSFSLCIAARAASVKDFGAIGDGKADDTAAIQRAVRESRDGILEFPRGAYRLTASVRIELATSGRISLQGGGVGRVVMAGPGPAFNFVGTHRRASGPDSFAPGVFERERMPHVSGLEIIGEHREAIGLEFSFVMQPIIRGTLIHRVRHGIRFAADGEEVARVVTSNRNVIIADSHIYNCAETGILFDSVDLHQVIITGNHISFCRRAGIRLDGASIRNLQITGNDIEYNFDPENECADIWTDVSRRGSVREGTIVGNTIQSLRTPGGANIRFAGKPGTPDKTGLWTIVGNHISAQETNIHLKGSRGVTISGNSFNRGGRQTVLIEGSRNIVLGANSVDNNPDYPLEKGQPWENGIVIRDSEGVLLNGWQVDGALQGSVERGGAIDIVNSRDVSVTGCQILDPKFRGVYADNSSNIQITGTLVTSVAHQATFAASIEISRSSSNVLIANNLAAEGINGTVLNAAAQRGEHTQSAP